ncbi:MAG: phosphate transporter [Geminicoccaceae bacterium]|nr:phosphate transporter [Geminicoccaceae bacterium]MDF2781270.1 phosphate transporter [Geminicoccaceae bacterium]
MASLESARPPIVRVPGRVAVPPRSARRSLAMLALAALVLALPLPARAGEPSDGYRFGVFPYLPVLTIDKLFGPMAVSFARVLDRPVYLKTKSSFEKFAAELANQTYDIVLLHPFFYVEAADNYHYRPLARVDQKLTAVALVAAERPWHGWHDLAGRILALPPEMSAVSQLVKAALIEAGLWPDIDLTLRHYGTKMSCLQAVVIGTADACAVPNFVLSQIEPGAEMKLRTLAETAPINHLVIAAHERLPAADRAKLLATILSWPGTAKGRAILAAGTWPGFVAAKDSEYHQIRRYRSRLRTLAQR